MVFVSNLSSGGDKVTRIATTASALAKAKEALLAYAITGDAAGRPGEFPCPTSVATNSATYGASATGCATVSLGRIPWKTLGIQEIFDGDGEPLWYVVSSKFRPPFTPARIINSDTAGDLTVYDASGSTVLESKSVVIIFSAGAPIAGQNRTSTASLCATTSTSIAGNICAANYLESSSSRNNATNAGPYISARLSATFNDQIAYITTADFIPKIEDRILATLTRALNNYYVANGYYPFATTYSDMTFPNRLNCANATYSGRLPVYIASSPYGPPSSPCTGLEEWPGVANPNSLPAWFNDNEWNAAIHYVVGKAFEKGGAKICGILGDCLTVDGDNTVQAAFILTGTASSTQTRPSSIPTNYLEAAANLNNWPNPTTYTYETTTSILPSRDRVVAIKNP